MTTRPVRITIVDEEESLTDVLVIALGLEGWDVRVAGSGAEALASVHDFDPDIVVLDMTLPDANGVDVLKRLRAAGVSVPVMFLTGRTGHEDRMAAFMAGADDYMTKPFGLEDVTARLSGIVRRIGLSPHSRRFGDLVIDSATAEAWRAQERILLTSVEFELLYPLVVETRPLSVGRILQHAAQRGISLTRDAAERLLEQVRAKLNSGRDALMHLTADGEWTLSTA